MELWISLVCSASAALVGLFLIRQQAASARWFAFVCLSAAAYVLPLTLLFATASLLFSTAVIVTGALTLAAALLFALAFAGMLGPWHLLLLVPLAIVAILAPGGSFVAGTRPDGYGSIAPVNGPYMADLVGIVAAYCIATWTILAVGLRRAAGTGKAQAWLLLVATSVLLGSILVCNVLAPAIGFAAANMVTGLSVAAFAGIVAYGLSARRLFDVQLVLYRTAAYGVVPFGVAAGIGMVIGAFELARVEMHPRLWVLAALAGGVGGALAAQYLQPGLVARARRALYPDLPSEDAFRELVLHALEPLASREELARILRTLVVAMFRPRSVSFESGTVQGGVAYDAGRLEIRIEGLGRYRLHGRRSGEAYTQADEALALRALPALEGAARRATAHDESALEQAQAERRLVADVAHGLQTPLAVLRAGIEGETGLPAASRARGLKAVDDLSARIRGLIAYARAGVPVTMRQREPVRLDRLVQDVVEYVGVVAAEQGVALRSEGDDPVTVLGKPDDLATLVTNLLSNAVRHAAAGSGLHEVFISLARESHEVVLTIADTGPGMTAEERAHAFEPRYRGTGAPWGSGMGLGLAIVRQVASAHGGSVRLDARAGGGMRVVVALPAIDAGNELLH